jgi:hypothetical protein
MFQIKSTVCFMTYSDQVFVATGVVYVTKFA